MHLLSAHVFAFDLQIQPSISVNSPLFLRVKQPATAELLRHVANPE